MSNRKFKNPKAPHIEGFSFLKSFSAFFRKTLDKNARAEKSGFEVGVFGKPLSLSYPQTFPHFPQVF